MSEFNLESAKEKISGYFALVRDGHLSKDDAGDASADVCGTFSGEEYDEVCDHKDRLYFEASK